MASTALAVYANDGDYIDSSRLEELNKTDGVKRAFGRRSVFGVTAGYDADQSIETVDIISYGKYDLEALKKDGMLERGCNLENVIEDSYTLIISDGAVRKGDIISAFVTQLPIAGKLKCTTSQ